MIIEIPDRFEFQVQKLITELIKEEEHKILEQQYQEKGAKFWNDHLDYTNEQIKITKDGLWQWDQLVNQEIDMFAALAKPITDEHFQWICNRRGFNDVQRQFLIDAINYMGIPWGDKNGQSEDINSENMDEPGNPKTKMVKKG